MGLVYEGTTLNKKFYRSLSPTEYAKFVDSIFEYYRNKGFPYVNLTLEERYEEFEKLKNYTTDLIRDDVVIQRMACLSLAWHYFPHAWEIPITGIKQTPMDIFRNDKLFREAIVKRLKFGDNMSDNGIRKALMVFRSQRVSNFRPTAAKAIYHYFLKQHSSVVWDMSAGFGGRLLGALASKEISLYVGTDPSIKTFNGLEAMIKDFLFVCSCSSHILPIGSENFEPLKNSLDLCFTSPPYFNTELYSDEPTQSYKKFPEQEQWVDGYLRQTLKHCFHGLKSDGLLVLNIANVKTFDNLEQVTLQVASEVGFKHTKTMKYMLSKVPSIHGEKKVKYKFEPIFVFQK